ncbi:MAG: DUF2933 domain-containing protein [Burkholderiaceae bacterium]
MATDPIQQNGLTSGSTRPPRTLWVAAAMTALIATFFLLREHWSHVAGFWPYLLLLACPLMHLFHGHGGHGEHRAHGANDGRAPDREA